MRAQRNRVMWCLVFGAVVAGTLIAASRGSGSENPTMRKPLVEATNAQDAGGPWKRVMVATTASFRGLSAVTAEIVWAPAKVSSSRMLKLPPSNVSPLELVIHNAR